jgi:hypothetical protein
MHKDFWHTPIGLTACRLQLGSKGIKGSKQVNRV